MLFSNSKTGFQICGAALAPLMLIVSISNFQIRLQNVKSFIWILATYPEKTLEIDKNACETNDFQMVGCDNLSTFSNLACTAKYVHSNVIH